MKKKQFTYLESNKTRFNAPPPSLTYRLNLPFHIIKTLRWDQADKSKDC